jgi:hypothetical protein
LARLPTLGPDATLRVWTNALRLIENAEDPKVRHEAQAVADAVEYVWSVRASGETPDGWFKWPTTFAPGGDGSLSGNGWLEFGPLKALGYRVGRDGEAPGVRWAILKRAFEGALPPIFPRAYLTDWGGPGSPARLHKMADSLASFARSAKRRDADLLRDAIDDWEHDLRHLYDVYYVGRFGFAWPTTRVL